MLPHCTLHQALNTEYGKRFYLKQYFVSGVPQMFQVVEIQTKTAGVCNAYFAVLHTFLAKRLCLRYPGSPNISAQFMT